jgi:hypothetical protein
LDSGIAVSKYTKKNLHPEKPTQKSFQVDFQKKMFSKRLEVLFSLFSQDTEIF